MGYNKAMAKRLNVPTAVRTAARSAAKNTSVSSVGGIRKVKRSAVNAGYQTSEKRISWNYRGGDLVRFRDYTSELRFGTVIAIEGAMVSIMSSAGMVRMPCQSISLIERFEENPE